jgi:hypothetical protein
MRGGVRRGEREMRKDCCRREEKEEEGRGNLK